MYVRVIQPFLRVQRIPATEYKLILMPAKQIQEFSEIR